jgi:type IV secretory pathway VirB10-like protein
MTGSAADAAGRADAPARRNAASHAVSRKVLAGLGLVVGLGLGGALIYALQNRNAARPDELYSTDNRATADGLAGLPRDYTGVPVLGPAAARATRDAPFSTRRTGASPSCRRRSSRTASTRRSSGGAKTKRPARTSRVFFQSGADTARRRQPRVRPTMPAAHSQSPALARAATRSNKPRRTAARIPQRGHRSAHRRTRSRRRSGVAFVLQAGAVISAALITGIRSDLPGQITAQVTENIYDSPTGRILLVPQGTRIIGQYTTMFSSGSGASCLVWNRLIFPNGRSIVLERQPGADTQGYAGLRTASIITGGISPRPRVSPRCSASAPSSPSTTRTAPARHPQRRRRTPSTTPASRSSDASSTVAPTLTIRPGFPGPRHRHPRFVLEPYRG